MNNLSIKLFAILGIISGLLGLLFSFLPISNLAIFPAILGLLSGLIAFYFSKKNGRSISFPRIVMFISLLAILVSFGKQLFTENVVVLETETIERDAKSEEDAVKELEELDELEDLE